MSRPRYEIYKGLTMSGQRWRWRLRAGNGEIIAHGESYHHKQDAIDAVELVKGSAHIERVELER